MTTPVPRGRRRTVVRRRPPAAVTRPATVAPAGIRTIVVAVPARDEADHIETCLRSIDGAAEACGADVHVVVAADRCRDATAQLATTFSASACRVTVVEGRWRSVGAARAAAVAAGTAGRAGVWIANTDADCRVPRDWLSAQLALAERGLDAVAGSVRLAADAPSHLAAGFQLLYASKPGGQHVHAANLGVRLDAYAAVGGWSPSSALGEDHHLWRRLRRGRFAITHHPGLWVCTSHRTRGRAPGGFATALRRAARAAAPALADTA